MDLPRLTHSAMQKLIVIDKGRNVMLANLIQETPVADTEQPGGALTIPASLRQSAMNRMNLSFVAKAAKRQVNRRLYMSRGPDYSVPGLPPLGANSTHVIVVLRFGFRVIHIKPWVLQIVIP